MSHRFWAVAAAAFLLGAMAQAQNQPVSLGDVAAQAHRKRMRTMNRRPRVITNDDLVVMEPAIKTRNSKSPSAATSPATEENASTAGPAVTVDPRSATSAPKGPDADTQWGARLADQKAKVALLQREVDVAERETRMRQAVYYSDAGSRLRDPGAFDQANLKDHDEIENKRADLAKASAELDAMREQARKAGASSKVYQ